MKEQIIFLFLFFLYAHLVPLSAQRIDDNFKIGDTTQVHRILTYSGDLYIGLVTQFNSDQLTLLFHGDELVFDNVTVRRIYVYDREKWMLKNTIREEMFDVTGSERLLIMSSAYSLPKGSMEYSTFFIYNSLTYGLTNRLDLRISSLFGVKGLTFGVEAKYSDEVFKNVHLGANFTNYFNTNSSTKNQLSFSAISGLVSIGTRESFLHFSYGVGLPHYMLTSSNETPNQWYGILNYGGKFRLSKKWGIFGDIIIPNWQGLHTSYTFGLSRFTKTKRIGFGFLSSEVTVRSRSVFFPDRRFTLLVPILLLTHTFRK